MIVSIKKTFHTCTAHRLMNHPGACKNLHGHNYAITVHVMAKELDAQGMVVDFGTLKSVLKPQIDSFMDHKCVLQIDDPLYAILEQAGMPVTYTNGPPTAENMANDLLNGLGLCLISNGLSHLEVVQVDVEETRESVATAYLELPRA